MFLTQNSSPLNPLFNFPTNRDSPTLQLYPLFDFCSKIVDLPISTLLAHLVNLDVTYTRFLHKITYLRKFQKSDILCIQTYIWEDGNPSSQCVHFLWMDSSMNWPADRALAQQSNARVHSVHGMSMSAFDPWWAVPIEGLETS